MSSSTKQLHRLHEIFHKGYIRVLKQYYHSKTMHDVIIAIRNRYNNASWTRDDISDFLANCHDRNGRLKQNFETTNPVYAVVNTPQGLTRYVHFFGSHDQPDRRDAELSDKERFILDAVHFDIVRKLQISPEAEGNEKNPLGNTPITRLQNVFKSENNDGLEYVHATSKISEWSLRACGWYFRTPRRIPGVSRHYKELDNENPHTWCINIEERISSHEARWQNFSKTGFALFLSCVAAGSAMGAFMGLLVPIPGFGILGGALLGLIGGTAIGALGFAAAAIYLHFKSKKSYPKGSGGESSYQVMNSAGLRFEPGTSTDSLPLTLSDSSSMSNGSGPNTPEIPIPDSDEDEDEDNPIPIVSSF